MTDARSSFLDSGARAPLLAAAVLLAVYVATLAPDITFWDAGEFVAAARTLGIPHPPGTPLFVLILSAWAHAFPFLSFPAATNLFSAFVTAGAAALSAALILRATRDGWAAAAGALCAGGMSSVWLNATETEVYAASLALAVVTVICGERAGRTGSLRWRVLVAYLLALAVPLHLSALLAAPAVIYLASSDDRGGKRGRGRLDPVTLLALTGVFLIVVGVGTATMVVAASGLVVLAAGSAVAVVLKRRGREARAAAPSPFAPPAMLLAAVLALSAVAFLLVRARFDPAINQGNPSDLRTLFYVLARRQYAVPPMWPRLAPWWLQIGNLFEYVDWQVALSLAPSVVPGVARVATTAVFLALGAYGSVRHRDADRRSWRGVALLVLFGTLGAIAYLNLRASPSFGWGVIPDAAVREARERDYFFVLGFWGWGLWAGVGGVALARRVLAPVFGRASPVHGARAASAAGLAVAMLPVALNWRAVDRRSAPESELPRVFGTALLQSAPPDAVLLVAGDNDTYPLWALQQVDGIRRDVDVITIPLLAAGWSQQEAARRTGLLPGAGGLSSLEASARIARAAREHDRPVAVSVMVTPEERRRIGSGWVARGLVYEARDPGVVHAPPRTHADSVSERVVIDSGQVRAWRDSVEHWRAGRAVRGSTDPLNGYVMELLRCPALLLERAPSDEQIRSLDSTCNRR